MKTSLKALSLFLAFSVPGALAVEFAGVNLPAGVDATAAFAAFFVTLFALIVVADYSRPGRSRRALVPATTRREKALHPLAA